MSGQPSRPPMRERIVAAAVQVIREQGVTAATTKEIARTAGVSEGSLYNHFENKSALFGAAFGAITSGVRAATLDISARVGQDTVEDNLAGLAAAMIRFYGELLPAVGPVLSNPELRDWLRSSARGAGPVKGHESLIRYLVAEQRAGRLLPQARPPVIVASLLGACQQYAFLSLLADPVALTEVAGLPVDVDEYARQVAHTVLRAQIP